MCKEIDGKLGWYGAHIIMEFCCDIFKQEWESDPHIHQDDIHRDDRDGNLYFWFEGCRASFPLIYCPNCGKKLE